MGTQQNYKEHLKSFVGVWILGMAWTQKVTDEKLLFHFNRKRTFKLVQGQGVKIFQP